jgi:large subunit ribosomal protein L13
VTNASQVKVTGRKADQILYRKHTLYPGGLKEIKYKDMMSKKPDEVRRSCIPLDVALDWVGSQIIRKAVSGMLPKNKLRERRLERLRIFEGPDMGIFQKNILKRWEDGTLNSTPSS